MLIVDFDLFFIIYIHRPKTLSIIGVLFIELNISSVVYLFDTWIKDSKLICGLVADVYILLRTLIKFSTLLLRDMYLGSIAQHLEMT